MHADFIGPESIRRAERRTRRAWFEDGLPELGCGAVCLGGALFFAAAVYEPRLWLVLPVGFLGGALLHNRIFFELKARVTDRRTGYLRLSRPSRRYQIRLILALTVFNVTTARLADAVPSVRPWLDAFFVAVPAAALVAIGVQTGLVRFFGLAAVALVAGAAVLLSDIPKWPAVLVFLTSLGAALLVSGTFALRDYLHDQPEPMTR